MLKFILPLAAVCFAASAFAGEYHFDFGQYPEKHCPSNFVSVVSGEGQPGDWKILLEDDSGVMAPFSSKAPQTNKKGVLAQLSKDPANEHFPILLFTNEVYGDFTLTTKFRIVSGSVAQMAGIAFRATDEKNYYVVCASASDNYFRFYKSVGNVRSTPIGKRTSIPAGVWHELKITCKGTEIRCMLDGEEALPPLNDDSFSAGKIGFWTKSDSVSEFSDATIVFTPRVPFLQTLVKSTLKEYPRLLGLKVYTVKDGHEPKVTAADKPQDVGAIGGKMEADTIAQAHTYFAKKEKSVEVTVPLRDRNGDVAAALKVEMRTFKGETEVNAINRAGLIRKFMETRMSSVTDLNE